MRRHAESRSLSLATICVAALVLLVVAGALTAPRLGAQVPATQPPTPQWQIDAGGKMAFDVVSVKPNTCGPSCPVDGNMPTNPGNVMPPNGGLFTVTNFSLNSLIAFAFKIYPNQSVASQLPNWAKTYRFDIEARAEGNPTKDQMRLMAQSLLADRFKLAIHHETRQLPVYALVLDKPGKLGPQLRQHPDDSPCSTEPPPGGSEPRAAATVDGGFPEICGGLFVWPPQSADGPARMGARNVTMELIAITLTGGVDRPVLDKTGLTGRFDFLMEFTAQRPLGADDQPGSGPTFLEAVKEQLGLKFEPTAGPVDVLVVDHIEEPSPN
jgi:uncharacterized protein (TIGR03435 family)